MKLKTTRPLYLGGEVRPADTVFEATEIHGRQLLQKGYAVESGDGEAVVQLDENGRNVEHAQHDVLDTNSVISPAQVAAQAVKATGKGEPQRTGNDNAAQAAESRPAADAEPAANAEQQEQADKKTTRKKPE